MERKESSSLPSLPPTLSQLVMVGERERGVRGGDPAAESEGGGWWADQMDGHGCTGNVMEAELVRRHHRHHEPRDDQCSSHLVMHIKAPVHLVWSLVRRFDQPQKYKPFVSQCIAQGDLEIGSVREVNVKSGLPATTSTERLELLDDDEHVLSIRILGGDHRLRNYSSVVTVHPEIIDGRPGTLVIESFVVDVPDGNTKDETCYFVEALIKCNLKSLANVSERLAVQDAAQPNV
ncbi:abscisic acid receptor PYL8-like [Typha latifolia]|uniref:abscisic acid receptor PYL8-like n=1 Tax=Typha latifolia TaxID=4733 RepID=UPI003C3005CD